MTDRQHGKIKWFSEGDGYGFITPDDGGRDIFLHAEVCDNCGVKVAPGMAVQFETVPSSKGPRASWVGANAEG
jgi:cold shock protein